MIDAKSKQEVTETLYTILETWSKHEGSYVENMTNFFDEGFSGFGTEFSETWKSKQDMVDQQIRDHTQAPGGFSYQVRDLQVYGTNQPLICICCFLMDMVFDRHDGAVHLKDYRHSVVFQRKGSRWLSVHWHASKGGKNIDEEVFPGVTGPNKYEEVSILFTDFVGFTTLVSTIPPRTLVSELNEIFSAFDRIVQQYGVMKVKTIGDAYMAVAGLSQKGAHAQPCVSAAQDMISYLKQRNKNAALKWEIRIGIHSGPVVGGFVGIDETNFDIWGDTVNTASHMEMSGAAGKINISAYTYHLVHKDFPCIYRGKVEAKGKGPIDMYFVDCH